MEGTGELDECANAEVCPCSFHPLHEAQIQVRRLGQLRLSEAETGAMAAHVGRDEAEDLGGSWRGHPRAVRGTITRENDMEVVLLSCFARGDGRRRNDATGVHCGVSVALLHNCVRD